LDISLLKNIVTKLANGESLDPKYKAHPLTGDWICHRECHIQSDWLLVYRYEDDVLVLTLARIGTHSDLFNL
jgi:mRNA interferase YafQ